MKPINVNEEKYPAIPAGQLLKDNSLKAAPSFTPGPWLYHTGKLRPHFSTVIHEIQDATKTAIVAWSGFDGVDFSQEQIAANARLIAAAPALYTELSNLLTAFHETGHGTDNLANNALLDCRNVLCVQSKAALARAFVGGGQ